MITITVSWIKRTWLRRLALIVSFPLVLLIITGQAAILGLVVMLCEPMRRLFEVWCVVSEAWPTFKKQWRDLPTPPSQEGQP